MSAPTEVAGRSQLARRTVLSWAGALAAGGGVSPWVVETHRDAGTPWLTTSRGLPSAPQPWMEVQTIFGAEAELDDPRIARAAATFSSSYSAPHLKWMEMGDLPGHVLCGRTPRDSASGASAAAEPAPPTAA